MKVIFKKGVFISFWVLIALISSCIQKGNNNISSSISSSVVSNQVPGFEMPVVAEPDIPGNTVTITDFGAVNDGQTLNTKAIADAIDEVSKKGVGRW